MAAPSLQPVFMMVHIQGNTSTVHVSPTNQVFSYYTVLSFSRSSTTNLQLMWCHGHHHRTSGSQNCQWESWEHCVEFELSLATTK
jgi:hypothetical protein